MSFLPPSVNIRTLFFMSCVIAASFIFGRYISYVPFEISIAFALGLVISAVTFYNTDLGLLIIIFSMLLSPEIEIAALPGRSVVLRIEDFLLLIVTFTWLVKMAVYKELGLIRKTPLNIPIGIYIAAYTIATLQGMLLGYVMPLKGLFYILKYTEYFFLYFMVANQLHTRSQVKLFVTAFILTCAITCLYANLHIGTVGRIFAPFDPGEPNTLGGYLVFLLAVVMGIFLYTTSAKIKISLAILSVLFILPAFLFSLSRTSYISIIPMWISLIILGPRKKMLITILVLALALAFIFMPEPVRERIRYTFTGKSAAVEPVVIGGLSLDPSASARIWGYKDVYREWKKYPIFGYGITGLGFIDGQYIRTLGELGIVGSLAFLFLLWSVFNYSKKVFLKLEDSVFKGLSLGFIAGFIALIIHASGANTFILIRIMEPFWFMAGMVMLLPEIVQDKDNFRR